MINLFCILGTNGLFKSLLLEKRIVLLFALSETPIPKLRKTVLYIRIQKPIII